MLKHLCTKSGAAHSRLPPSPVKKKNNKKKNNNNTADREIEVFFGARLIAVQGHIDPRLLLPRARCAGKSVKRPGKSPQAVSNCSNLCDSVCSLSAYLHKRALSSSLSQYSAARPASERYRATAHVGYSCPALASASNDQAAKAAMSVLERVENYSENLTLVTRRDRAWVRPSIQMQTTLFQWRGAVSNIASKFPGPETRAMQPARKRSDRTNPGERAGKRLLQPLFCGAQEG